MSNLKVKRDYYKAMERVLERTQSPGNMGKRKEDAVPPWQIRRMSTPPRRLKEGSSKDEKSSDNQGS